jgi:hypothetical protein
MHIKAFRSAAEYLEDIYKQIIDNAARKLTRCCFLVWDKNVISITRHHLCLRPFQKQRIIVDTTPAHATKHLQPHTPNKQKNTITPSLVEVGQKQFY